MLKVSLIACLLISLALSENLRTAASQKVDLLYTSISLISKVDFSTLTPSISSAYYPYITPAGPLGYNGPLGPFGPLGSLGPIGSNTWSLSQIVTGFDWSKLSGELTLEGGPLSSSGPLGSKGPLNPSRLFGEQAGAQSGDYIYQMTGLGIFTSIGPLAALGALGPLGPLGPVGAHGFQATSDGQYVDSANKVMKQITVQYDESSTRNYELFEVYKSTFAKSNPSVLDTSFMIQGYFGLFGPYKEQFTFTSNSDQIVTILLVPEKSLDSFQLSIYNESKTLIDTSYTGNLIEHFIMQVKSGQKITVEVQLITSLQALTKDYRLIVVGSTSYLNINNVTGNHIKKYTYTPK